MFGLRPAWVRASRSGNLSKAPVTTPFMMELLPGRGLSPVSQPVTPFPPWRILGTVSTKIKVMPST
jgi:hypothetical protein